MVEISKETLDNIIKRLNQIGIDESFYDYGLPTNNLGCMALMREAIREEIAEGETK